MTPVTQDENCAATVKFVCDIAGHRRIYQDRTRVGQGFAGKWAKSDARHENAKTRVNFVRKICPAKGLFFAWE
jgi:hypothetical protein